MNIKAAEQAANSVDLAIRAGGVQAALANIDLLIAIAEALQAARMAAASPATSQGEAG